MRNSQLLIGLVFAASLGLALGSCGSSSSTNSDGSTSGTGKLCPGTTGTCTQAEIETYDNCVYGQCGSAVAACYGTGYQSGSYSGPCASYATCAAKCGCTDSACKTACGQPSTDCSTCQNNIGICAFGSTCTIPACLLGGSGVGGTSGGTGGHAGGAGGSAGGLGGSTGATGTCADLLACCNAANVAVKPTCMNGYTTVMSMGDGACGQLLAQIKASVCP